MTSLPLIDIAICVHDVKVRQVFLVPLVVGQPYRYLLVCMNCGLAAIRQTDGAVVA